MNIDTRVVRMQMDNQQFEQEAQQSLKTLDRLKGATGDSSAYDNLSKALMSVQNQFSTLGIIGTTALMNITNKAVDAGLHLAKSLSIDQVSAGWQKYADKTSAVQTIMGATRQAFSDEAEQMKAVNEQLNKLNWFTDETSYNFVDMVGNVGKFTSNNIKLEDAVNSMQGIATWAASSGANVTQASRAMYNLSQAMGMGAVTLRDWMSIENANMATVEFKQTAMETAAELGKLRKNADGTFTAFDQGGHEVAVTVQSFREGLQTKWFTGDVLVQTLNKYGGFATALKDVYDETGLLTSRLVKYTKQYKQGTLDIQEVSKDTGMSVEELDAKFKMLSADEYELGLRSFEKAQEAKTFAEVIASVQDAVSTGWMNTFELIFGDYTEAKEFWTFWANELYDVFTEGTYFINGFLKIWKDGGGRSAWVEGLQNTWAGISEIIYAVTDNLEMLFEIMLTGDPDGGAEFMGASLIKMSESFRDSSKAFREALEADNAKIKKWIEHIASYVLVIATTVKRTVSTVIAPFSNMFDVMKTNITDAISYWLSFSDIMLKFIGKSGGDGPIDFLTRIMDERKARGFGNAIFNLESALEVISNVLTPIADTLTYIVTDIFDKLWDNQPLTRLFYILSDFFNSTFAWLGNSGIGDGISRLLTAIYRIGTAIVSKVVNAVDFTGIAYQIKDALFDFLDALSPIADTIISIVESFADWIEQSDALRIGLTYLSDGIEGLFNGIKENEIFDSISSGIDSFFSLIKKVFEGLDATIDFDKIVQRIFTVLSTFVDFLRRSFTKGGMSGVLSEINAVFGSIVSGFAVINSGNLFVGLTNWMNGINSLGKGLGFFGDTLTETFSNGTFWSGLKGLFGNLGESFSGFLNDITGQSAIDPNAILKIAGSIAIIAGAMAIFASIDPGRAIAGIGAMAATLEVILFFMKQLQTAFPDSQKGGFLSGIFGKNNSMTKSIANVGKLAGALIILAIAVKILSEIDAGSLFKAVLGLGGILGVMALFSKYIDTKGMKRIVSFAVGMLILSGAMKVMSTIEAGALWRSVGAIAALLLAFTLFSSKGISNIGFASTAVGILILAGAMKVIGSMDDSALIKSIGAIAILLAIMWMASSIMNPIMLAGLSLGMISFAVAVAATAASMALLLPVLMGFSLMPTKGFIKMGIALGIVLAAILGFALVAKVVQVALKPMAILAGVIALIGAGIFLLGLGIASISTSLTVFLANMGTWVPLIIAFFTNIFTGLIAFFKDIIVAAIAFFDDIVVTVVEFVMHIIMALAREVVANLPELLNILVDFCTQLILGLAQRIPELLDAIAVLVISFLNGLATTLDNHTEEFWGALLNFFRSVLGFLGIEIGPDVDVWSGDFVGQIASSIGEWVKKKTGEIVQFFKNLGGDIVDGLVKGVKAGWNWLTGAGAWLGDAMVTASQAALDSHSPSRVFMRLGQYCVEGLTLGVRNYADSAAQASGDMATGVVNSFADILNNGLEDVLNTDPVITPVLDLSEIQNEAAGLDGLLSMTGDITMARRIGGNIAAGEEAASTTQNSTTTITNGNNVFNIYGQPGMNVNDIADAVERKFVTKFKRGGFAFR